jgi:hypothetical protein
VCAFDNDEPGGVKRIPNSAVLTQPLTSDSSGCSSRNQRCHLNWSLTGNTPTASQFLGTTNSTPLRFVTNTAEVARFQPNGFFGIGTVTPTTKTEILTQSDLTLGASVLRLTNRGNGTTTEFTQTGLASNVGVGSNPNYFAARIYAKYDGNSVYWSGPRF